MKPYYEDKWVRIYNQNCLDTMNLMPDNIIDLTVTSPPYDNLREYRGYSLDFENVASELYRVTKQGGTVVWIVNDATIDGDETGTSFKQALYFKAVGFRLHDTMIWSKPTFTATGALQTRYAPTFEFMFVFTKGKIKTFNPIKDRKNKRNGDVKHGTVRQANGTTKIQSSIGREIAEFWQRFNVWEMSTEQSNSNRRHPAQFPERLANDHIISWSNEGDLVFDPFVGSGTTLKMAKLNNRKSIGVDISEEYCQIAKERCSQEVMELSI